MASEIFDKYGNRLYCIDGMIRLQLKDGETRTLGIIRKDTFYTRRSVDTHVMNGQRDIGFNWQLMKKGKFRNVEVEMSNGQVLRATREKIVEQGTVKMFKRQGYELQIFVPLNVFDLRSRREESHKLEEVV